MTTSSNYLTSSPRAATEVATNTGMTPFLKPDIVESLSIFATVDRHARVSALHQVSQQGVGVSCLSTNIKVRASRLIVELAEELQQTQEFGVNGTSLNNSIVHAPTTISTGRCGTFLASAPIFDTIDI